jgi:protoporphyrinogen oxidase
MGQRTAVIIGAGPAGLTAAFEFLRRTDIVPVVLEATAAIGGISQTVNYKGNRIDIGGHRFFSKSERVMDWWKMILPVQGAPARDYRACGREIFTSREPGAPDPETVDQVMLVRSRLSRILFQRKFYDYPISLSADTVRNLGLARMMHIGASYLRSRCAPVRPEKSLEDFLVNRFGRELYRTFFKDYTEKVWGLPPSRISPEWGAQRIKTLSIGRALGHAVKCMLRRDSSLDQKGTETSLIEQFLYPKYGPGQLWELVARGVQDKGGHVLLNHRVTRLCLAGNRAVSVQCLRADTGETVEIKGDYFLSSMPVRDLMAGMDGEVPPEVQEVARGLVYRDFLTVGLLLKDLAVHNHTTMRTPNGIIPDNWIYVQEPDVKLGRLQVFNNWSPYMVRDPNTAWLGLEYFCAEGDGLWNKPDDEMSAFAVEELARIGVIRPDSVLDRVVIRIPKAYPAYFGTYHRFDVIRHYVDRIPNLFLVGRNGMHRYNNQDHSMLSAMLAVEGTGADVPDKAALWQVNAEEQYHEEK